MHESPALPNDPTSKISSEHSNTIKMVLAACQFVTMHIDDYSTQGVYARQCFSYTKCRLLVLTIMDSWTCASSTYSLITIEGYKLHLVSNAMWGSFVRTPGNTMTNQKEIGFHNTVHNYYK